ncbi:OLC1v1036981C1 [Oldenlandia corymbosa var. corymbosa]|uniref:OLC1v1036981C1 n=1 Tax=Oldenlandia corymbosa var. corymbosa TaxID=529605 RepID=A0AAV1CZ91_OLDCO|nr:OLC1v1036981C1 [Oldenlandia corymbosa var. corymbosa]
MAVSSKYWDDCVDPEGLEAMWADPDVRAELLNVGEAIGSKINLSRDPDGCSRIIVRRRFVSQIDSDMLCAIATLESDRQPLATQYNKKSKETMLGIMQILPKTAEWLARDLGYRNYEFSENPKHLYKPFVNVYFGAAYLKWISTYDQKKLHIHRICMICTIYGATLDRIGTPLPTASSATTPAASTAKAPVNTTWDSRTSKEDMKELWNNASGGVSEIILAKHFNAKTCVFHSRASSLHQFIPVHSPSNSPPLSGHCERLS